MKSCPFWEPQVGSKERELINQVLDSNFLNDGKFTSQFEQRVAELLGAKYAVAVTSGTVALYLSLVALGIGPGDEVIVPDITFIATANAVTMSGATPVLVDVDPETLNLDTAAAGRAITPRTKAIMPVHVSGRTVDIEGLVKLGDKYGLPVVEDAAEAFMSRHRGKALGTFGKTGCFSLSPNKTITSGQGGLIVTDDEELYIRLRELKDQGRPVRGTGGADTHVSVGYNFKFTNLQAAVGLGQLEELQARVERLRSLYLRYQEGLARVEEISLVGFDIEGGEVPQWIDAIVPEYRDELDDYLQEHNIFCRRFWFPIHTQAPYKQPDSNFPHSTRLVPQALWLPSAFTLTDEDVARVCQHIKEFFRLKSQAVKQQGVA